MGAAVLVFWQIPARPLNPSVDNWSNHTDFEYSVINQVYERWIKGGGVGSKPVRMGVLFLIVASLLVIIAPTASADVTGTVYLPWVPNRDATGGLGPWFGRIELQNPSSSTCIVKVTAGVEGGSWPGSTTVDLGPHEMANLSPESIGLPEPGGAVVLNSSGCKATAAVKQASGGFNDAPWSHGADEITGYTGIPQEDVGGSPDWILPIVQTNNSWDSYIRVSNVDDTSVTRATIEIFSYQNEDGKVGSDYSVTVTIAAGATRTIDVHDAIPISGYVGFARVTSFGHIAALVQREKPIARMAMINVASTYDTGFFAPQGTGDYALEAPIVFNAYNGWNTGINLANPNDATANVTISYPGAGRPDDTLELEPYSADYVYTPGNAPAQSGFTGNAVIYSDVPIAASVDEVKYSTSDSISYTAVPAAASQLAVPVVFKQSLDGSRNDNSGINLSNSTDRQTTVEIKIYSSIGILIGGPFDLTIPAHSGNFIYLASVSVPSGSIGNATVTSLDGAGIVAVSNDVSYDITGNGSVVFNAPSNVGLYRIGGSN